MRSWGAAGLAVAIVFGAGCSGGSTAADPPDTTTVAATAATPKSTARVTTTTKSKTPPPPYSFDNSVPPPELVNTGKPRPQIVGSFIAYSAWLDAHHPDPALARIIAAEGSNAFSQLTKNLVALKEERTRLYEIKTAPDEVEIISATPTAFTARLVQHIQSQRLTEASGRITSQRPFEGPTTYIVLFVGNAERWELASVEEQF